MHIFGNGTLATAGKLSEANYTSAVLALLCMPRADGALRSYIVGGINYTLNPVPQTTGLSGYI